MKTIATALALQAQLHNHTRTCLGSFFQSLDDCIDARLSRTANLLLSLLCSAHQPQLTLTHLAAQLACFEITAQAWVKRLDNFLKSQKWNASIIDAQLLQHADEFVDFAEQSQKDCLLLWDDSVFEKPGTEQDPNLCSVHSTKVSYITRPRPGFISKLYWTSIPGLKVSGMVMATSKRSRIAHVRLWSSRGEEATDKKTVDAQMLELASQRWGQRVTHVFDRGYYGWPWLEQLLAQQVNFIVRWRSKYHLQAEQTDAKPAYHLVSGRKRTIIYVRDAKLRKRKRRKIVWRQVYHPKQPDVPLYLVVCSDGKRTPWYLLTNKVIETKEDARTIILSYSRRWEIEQVFRRNKTSQQSQSIQLRNKDKREKMYKLTLLAQNEILALNENKEVVKELLGQMCPRRGKRLNEEIKVPFERILQGRQMLRQLFNKRTEAVLLALLDQLGSFSFRPP